MNDPSCASRMCKGPIPPGKYYLNHEELTDSNIFIDLGREFFRGDWGNWRLGTHAREGTVTYGRDNFFLHGGCFDGSAGCIDIGGCIWGNRSTAKILSLFASTCGVTELVVVES